MVNVNDLVERGWSEAKIRKWLGDGMKFSEREVSFVEKSSKFSNWKKREATRTAKQDSKLKQALKKSGIAVRKIERHEVLQEAIKRKVAMEGRVPDPEWVFQHRGRLIHNYIRHTLVENYDLILKALNGHIKRDELYPRLRAILGKKVNRVYPNIEQNISYQDVLCVLKNI